MLYSLLYATQRELPHHTTFFGVSGIENSYNSNEHKNKKTRHKIEEKIKDMTLDKIETSNNHVNEKKVSNFSFDELSAVPLKHEKFSFHNGAKTKAKIRDWSRMCKTRTLVCVCLGIILDLQVREREGEGEKESESERDRDRERQRERERERGREGERESVCVFVL
jgi:hypothetical protein